MALEKLNFNIPAGSKWKTVDVEKKAKEMGLQNKSDLMVLAVDSFMNFDDEIMKEIRRYSDGLNVPIWLVMQNIIINQLAKQAAQKAADTYKGGVMNEFIAIDGEMLTGDKLMKHLVDQYTRDEQQKQKEVDERRRYYTDPEYRKQVDEQAEQDQKLYGK